MANMRGIGTGAAALVALLAPAGIAAADVITANCTGMLNLDIYEIDTEKAEQVVDGIGQSDVSTDETEITLRGDFGEYRFDLKAGTLYHNDKDTGVYCTYKTREGG